MFSETFQLVIVDDYSERTGNGKKKKKKTFIASRQRRESKKGVCGWQVSLQVSSYDRCVVIMPRASPSEGQSKTGTKTSKSSSCEKGALLLVRVLDTPVVICLSVKVPPELKFKYR